MYLVALSADGTVLAIGAPYQNGGPGYVRVHTGTGRYGSSDPATSAATARAIGSAGRWR